MIYELQYFCLVFDISKKLRKREQKILQLFYNCLFLLNKLVNPIIK